MLIMLNTLIIIVMSFNIRLDIQSDGINSWDNRKDILIDLLKEYSPDFLGMQEVRKNQLVYLKEKLSEYDYIGISRSEDVEDEHSPIFFKKDKFSLISSNTFWLSETPDKSSKGWDAAFNRIVSWGKFKEMKSDKILFVFNTHFDHIGLRARMESVKLLKKKIAEITGNEDYIVTGDFNFDPNSDFYKLITSKENSEIALIDVSQSDETTRKNIKPTFNGFDLQNRIIGPIDFIFAKPNISVQEYKVIDTLYKGRFPSDHFPIIAKLIFN